LATPPTNIGAAIWNRSSHKDHAGTVSVLLIVSTGHLEENSSSLAEKSSGRTTGTPSKGGLGTWPAPEKQIGDY